MNQQSDASDKNAERLQQSPEILSAEFSLLHPDAKKKPKGADLESLYEAISKLETPRSALCLSGGGIRSASFCLGVLQALARYDLLHRFHYLSTVSGGGYIGSWLSAWRHHSGDEKVFAALSKRSSEDVPQIRKLREFSNFLTPKLGITSADTWSGVALYIRNLFLNWLVLGPILFLVLTVPLGAYLTARWARHWGPYALPVLLISASLLLIAGNAISVATRPGGRAPNTITRRRYLVWILLPVYSAAVLLSLFAVNEISETVARGFSVALPSFLLFWALWGGGVYLISWMIGTQPPWKKKKKGWKEWFRLPTRDDPATPPLLCLAWTTSGAFVGMVFGGALCLWSHGAEELLRHGIVWDSGAHTKILVTFAITWSISAVLAGELLYVGLASYSASGDMEREWLARSSGWLAAAALSWSLFALIALFGYKIVQGSFNYLTVLGGGGITGLITMALAASRKTPATTQIMGKPFSIPVLSIVAPIFILCLLALLSAALQSVLGEWLEPRQPEWRHLLVVVVAFLALTALVLLGSYFVNVNRFSLHAVYRNRLIRAFLGAARATAEPKRDPDKFSGFDTADNLLMKDLVPKTNLAPQAEEPKPCLYHVINVTLNIVSTSNLAWQERKAESFVMTPHVCGNPRLGFRASEKYSKGISVGTAMAISGAAVSPNQGYHSSPVLGFLMTLFNVRLGWWLGNPGNSKTFWREGPEFGVFPLIRELLGLTTDKAPYVYLSDGGHFENLGIYEMVRRRAGFILAIDAGNDPDCKLEDLGNAVRKCAIDLGVTITFQQAAMVDPKANPDQPTYAAVGTIHYPEKDIAPGRIIYIKPGIFGTIPVDVFSYKSKHPEFPHETTLDQWFSESQLESYRSLGSYIIDQLIRTPGDSKDLKVDLAEFYVRTQSHLSNGQAQQQKK
jgi:hypothetical protein